LVTENFLPQKHPANILITSGASCPDALVESVIRKLASFYKEEDKIDALIQHFNN